VEDFCHVNVITTFTVTVRWAYRVQYTTTVKPKPCSIQRQQNLLCQVANDAVHTKHLRVLTEHLRDSSVQRFCKAKIMTDCE